MSEIIQCYNGYSAEAAGILTDALRANGMLLCCSQTKTDPADTSNGQIESDASTAML